MSKEHAARARDHTVNQIYSVNYSYAVHNSAELSTQGIKLRRYVKSPQHFHVVPLNNASAWQLEGSSSCQPRSHLDSRMEWWHELSTTFTTGQSHEVVARILFEI